MRETKALGGLASARGFAVLWLSALVPLGFVGCDSSDVSGGTSAGAGQNAVAGAGGDEAGAGAGGGNAGDAGAGNIAGEAGEAGTTSVLETPWDEHSQRIELD